MLAKTYIWEGLNPEGKFFKGEMQTSSLAICQQQLLQQNIFPTKIKSKLALWQQRKIPPKYICEFSRKFSLLINANIPIINALNISTQNTTYKPLQQILLTIKNDLSGGNNIVTAFKKHPRAFDELYCGLLAAGEKSGNLDVILQYIAEHNENIEQQKRKIIRALFYPCCVLLVAGIVTAILLIFVVPQFKTVFASFGAQLPLYTQMIINLAGWLQSNFFLLLAGCIGSIGAYKYLVAKSARFRYQIAGLSLQIPIAGKLMQNGILFHIMKTLNLTFRAGVPLLEALATCALTANNLQFQQALRNISTAVANGKSLHQAMLAQILFPKQITQLILIGEESGQLDAILDKICKIYAEEIQHTTDNLNNLLEPLIMVILGIIVGGLIIGMYLPIFRLGKIF